MRDDDLHEIIEFDQILILINFYANIIFDVGFQVYLCFEIAFIICQLKFQLLSPSTGTLSVVFESILLPRSVLSLISPDFPSCGLSSRLQKYIHNV